MASQIPITVVGRHRLETCTDVASAALLVFDYLLTFESEVTLMWPSPFSVVKVLFVLTRYTPFIDVPMLLYYQLKPNITAEECRRLYAPVGWMMVFGIIIAEVILVIRTWAIWDRGRNIAIALVVAMVCGVVPAIYIENIFQHSTKFSPYPGRASPGCLLSDGNPIEAVNFVIIIIFETFTLILTLIKGVEHYRIAGKSSGNFVVVLYRDGILFYFYLLGFSVINMLVIIVAPRDLADILATLQRVLHSCLSTRVLLNLRAARNRELQLSLNTIALQAIQTVQFAHPVDSNIAGVGDNSLIQAATRSTRPSRDVEEMIGPS